jgi:hypothetical protein
MLLFNKFMMAFILSYIAIVSVDCSHLPNIDSSGKQIFAKKYPILFCAGDPCVR